MRIARIFPTRTSTSPTDQDIYFGGSELFMPEYDGVYISVLKWMNSGGKKRVSHHTSRFGSSILAGSGTLRLCRLLKFS